MSDSKVIAGVSPGIDTARGVLALDAACGCAFGLRSCETAPNASAIHSIAPSETLI